MRKCDNYFAVSCYRYAPESFKAMYVKEFSHGNRNIPCYTKIELDPEEVSRCGNAYICKGRATAIAELKRIIRKREKSDKLFCTYGLTYTDNPRQYIYIREIRANENDIADKLRAYKEIKQWAENHNYKHTTFRSGSLNADMTFTEQDNTRELSRDLIVIHYRSEHNYCY